ncbi:aldehyde dehydrogenase family protein [Amycolatopsis magusensis]|uniref:aldehyde dehydrogenase family protein n=1 Tax=Amycolatopsis magusensis TaxID=882444 RepID=UPI003C2CFB16
MPETAATIATARQAQRAWAATPTAERGAALRQAGAALRARAGELAKANESDTGRLEAEAAEGVLAGAGTLEQYAELGPVHRGATLRGDISATDFMVPEPRGVVVALTPWNDPVAVACGLLGAALVTGNAVVHKPSERSPLTGALLGEILAECLPDGVLQTVSGDGLVGAELAGHRGVDLVAHVGSVEAGRAIALACARTGAKALLENGGNDPLVVDGDVDPAWAAGQAALGAFANSGQICVSVERIYVHQAVAEEFVAALAVEARTRGLLPLVDNRQRDKVDAHVRDAVAHGAQLLVGGDAPAGPQYPATVLTGCTADLLVMREETFGPVAPVQVVRDFDEGMAEAATGEYGLAATVLTRSMANAQRAWRELPAGTVKVNSVFGGAPGGAAEPRGVSGSGFGYGPELLDEMTQMKVVHLEPAP